jgi:hypothetical protein
MIGVLGNISLPRPSPHGVIKSTRPPAARFHLARGARGTLKQEGEPRGPLTTALAPLDGMDVTMHSQQEHGNHALTRHDPGHSTTMASIPPQQWGDSNCAT